MRRAALKNHHRFEGDKPLSSGHWFLDWKSILFFIFLNSALGTLKGCSRQRSPLLFIKHEIDANIQNKTTKKQTHSCHLSLTYAYTDAPAMPQSSTKGHQSLSQSTFPLKIEPRCHINPEHEKEVCFNLSSQTKLQSITVSSVYTSLHFSLWLVWLI